MNSLTKLYTKVPNPPLQQRNYSLHNEGGLEWIRVIAEKYRSSFHPNSIFDRNMLDPDIKLAPSDAIFATKPLSKTRSSAM